MVDVSLDSISTFFAQRSAGSDITLIIVNLTILILVFFFVVKHFHYISSYRKDLEKVSQKHKNMTRGRPEPSKKKVKASKADKTKDVQIPSEIVFSNSNYVVEESSKPEIGPWKMKRKDFNLKGELAYLSGELNQLHGKISQEKVESSNIGLYTLTERERLLRVLDKDLNRLENQLKIYRKYYGRFKKQYDEHNEFSMKIAQVDMRLDGRNSSNLPLSKQFSLGGVNKLNKLQPYDQALIQQELAFLKKKLAQQNKNFLETINHRFKRRKKWGAERSTIKFVRNMSQRLEEKQVIPPLELEMVTDELNIIKHELEDRYVDDEFKSIKKANPKAQKPTYQLLLLKQEMRELDFKLHRKNILQKDAKKPQVLSQEEQEATALVQRISREVEGDHRVPKKEIDRITDELNDVNSDLKRISQEGYDRHRKRSKSLAMRSSYRKLVLEKELSRINSTLGSSKKLLRKRISPEAKKEVKDEADLFLRKFSQRVNTGSMSLEQIMRIQQELSKLREKLDD